MKKILGLDLGTNSIGWAYITADADGKPKEIVNMGVRIVPLSPDEKGQFETGNTITKNRDRTQKRTMRKGYDRYQLRREDLREVLTELGMMPEESQLKYMDSLSLYALRDKALKDRVELTELGRVLWLLNQKRGYKSMRGTDVEDGKKVTEYELDINNRYTYIQQQGITIGQYFYQMLLADSYARLKQLVFPHHAYVEEYNAIMQQQKKHYPNVLTDEIIEKLRDKIIYYQRPLKSQKGLVSICEFEGVKHVDSTTGKVRLIGPKVAPRSSPLFQLCKVWESINSITVEDKYRKKRLLSIEEKQTLFEKLNAAELLKENDIFKLLGLKKGEYIIDTIVSKRGIQGNVTRSKIANVLSDNDIQDKWLKFELKIVDKVNEETGEVISVIDPSLEREPLYKLWHLLYSVKEKELLEAKLIHDFGFDSDKAKQLAAIDFAKDGFSNKSARNIRRILPSLMQGKVYSSAMSGVGVNHSNSKTKAEAAAIQTIDKLLPIAKNSLRQPTVEKILNQLVNVVNAIIADPTMGKPDEIRIELARELKQSREERNKTFSNNNKRDKEAKEIAKRLQEHKIKPSRKNIERYRLWQEFQELSAYGPYNPERKISFTQAFSGAYDIDHIIPQSKMFDDSFANKVLCTRKQNEDKGNSTAYDYMQSLGDDAFNNYLAKIDVLCKAGIITRTKRDRLLTTAADIPNDFINRQLNETRYIVRKAKEILAPLLVNKEHDIICTNGSVTAFLRHSWGWDDVLVNLNFDRYPDDRKRIELDQNGKRRRIIDNWSKRDDHRHHAIDALTIACTSRGVINRMNKLNQLLGKESSNDEGLKTYVQRIKAFDTKEIESKTSNMLVSIKPGKKVANKGKRVIKKDGKKIVAQEGIIIPRGSLSEETVYGRILHKGKYEYVVKYKLDMNFKHKDLEYVIDGAIRNALEKRLVQHNNEPKQAFKDLENNPVYVDNSNRIPIKSIRMLTNISMAEPVKYNSKGEAIGFVKPGNNHHIAIYENEKGKRIEKVISFLEAVTRKVQGALIIDNNPNEGTKFITSLQQNEMFVFNMNMEELQDAIANGNYTEISKNLFRVRKLSSGNYWFNHHLETQPRESVEDKKAGRAMFASSSSMKGIKVRINHLGQITKVVA